MMTEQEQQIMEACAAWYVKTHKVDTDLVAMAFAGDTGSGGKSGKPKIKHGPGRIYSHIRHKSVAWYAENNPTVDMKIIATALGYTDGHSIYNQAAVPGSSVGRKPGKGSAAYTAQKGILEKRGIKEKVLKYVLKHPQEAYRDIGARFGVSGDTVQDTALASGIYRGKGHGMAGPEPLVSDNKVKRFWRKFPKANVYTALRLLGYRGKGGQSVKRMVRLRKEALSGSNPR